MSRVARLVTGWGYGYKLMPTNWRMTRGQEQQVRFGLVLIVGGALVLTDARQRALWSRGKQAA